MVVPIIMNNGQSGLFFWNLSHDVGPGCPNAPDDVELVRFGYYCMGTNPMNRQTSPERKAMLANLPLQGSFDNQLQDIIRLHQGWRGGVQDGKISTIKNTSGNYSDKSWILVPLHNNMMDVMGDLWPRIDKHHQTSALLTQKIQSVFLVPRAP